MQKTITYFEQRGNHNTDDVLRLVRERAQELDIRQIVVPTTGGSVGLQATEALSGFALVVVTHAMGFSEPGHQEVPKETIEEIRAKGAHVLTATHAFGGVGRAVRMKMSTYQSEEIIAQTLRVFGQGAKVAIEISLMAADAGLITPHEEVISCGGSGRGLDTALVLRPAHAQCFFDLQVLEMICKPRVP